MNRDAIFYWVADYADLHRDLDGFILFIIFEAPPLQSFIVSRQVPVILGSVLTKRIMLMLRRICDLTD